MKKIFIRLLQTVATLFILLLSIELGLYLREYRKSVSDQKIINSDNNILLIGDSVFGDIDNPNSLASQFKTQLLQKTDQKMNVYNLSQPALSSWMLNQKIDDYLEKYNPSAVVILIGNSDYIVFNDSDKLVNNFTHRITLGIQTLKAAQLVQKIFSINNFQTDKDKIERGRIAGRKDKTCELKSELSKLTYSDLFWNCTDSKDYLKALENFEEMTKVSAPNIRMLLRAKDIYIDLNLKQKGAEIFAQFAQRTQDQYLASVSKQLIDQLNDYERSRDVEKISDRNTYLSQLMYFKKKGMDFEANELYKNLEHIPVFEDHLPDYLSLNRAIQKVLDKNSRVYAVQYPNQLLWPLELAAVKGSKNLYFIDSYQSIKSQLGTYSVNQIFEDDFLHLTEIGAKVVAKEMTDTLVLQMKEEKNESIQY